MKRLAFSTIAITAATALGATVLLSDGAQAQGKRFIAIGTGGPTGV